MQFLSNRLDTIHLVFPCTCVNYKCIWFDTFSLEVFKVVKELTVRLYILVEIKKIS